MRLGISLIISLCGLWLLWSGHYSQLFLLLGFASVMLVLLLSIRMDIVDPDAHPAHLTVRLLLYLPWLIWEIIKANIDVTMIILSPRMRLSPKVFEVEAFQKSELAQTIYANSITLTPGTVSIDVKDGVITVHAITEEMAQGLIDSDMDQRAAVLEGKQPTLDS